ncbi:hypothetical protein VTN77DRAFT_2282 [Rasamsonia byssochlamydoides]|uniref:uncharacterized protein n=1 Tax=Rasamsonia byssochlamydoides TaxID=89139 RepID=UPI0037442A59
MHITHDIRHMTHDTIYETNHAPASPWLDININKKTTSRAKALINRVFSFSTTSSSNRPRPRHHNRHRRLRHIDLLRRAFALSPSSESSFACQGCGEEGEDTLCLEQRPRPTRPARPDAEAGAGGRRKRREWPLLQPEPASSRRLRIRRRSV